MERKCWTGGVIETNDGYTCENDATCYFVDTRSGVILELCDECACWAKMIREYNFGTEDWIVIDRFENLEQKRVGG